LVEAAGSDWTRRWMAASPRAHGLPGELFRDLTGVDCSLRRPKPPMMRRALPSTRRKVPANCRPLPRHNVAMPSFRTARPWQVLKKFHRALRDLPRRDLSPYHEILLAPGIRPSNSSSAAINGDTFNVKLLLRVPVPRKGMESRQTQKRALPPQWAISFHSKTTTQMSACGPKAVRSAQVIQTSDCSAIARASSTSMPRYLTVLSILVWPSKSCTARRLPVRR
jgi:hypothetical protein